MRTDIDVSKRMREMLTQDKLCVQEGFVAAMKGDVTRLFDAYFVLASPVQISIDQVAGGAYEVSARFTASDIRRFDTTLDVKRY